MRGLNEAHILGRRSFFKMMRSMHSVISSLRNHQMKMDVIGNNIANVNTYGFKKGRVIFKDTLYQTMRTGSAPQDNRGGTNQMAIGLGMDVGAVDTIVTPGSSQGTGKNTDLCINGNGYFMVKAADEVFYTRAGLSILTRAALRCRQWGLVRWAADPENNWIIDTESKTNPQPINIGRLRTLSAQASTMMKFAAILTLQRT